MNKQTEALKLALAALKQIDDAMPFPVAKLAQKVIREALAQPAQQTCLVANEPCKHGSWCSEVYCQEHCTFVEQLAQQYNPTSDHRLMENAQVDLERIKLVQTGVGIGKPEQEPVAWMTPTGALYRTEDVDGCFDDKHIPLYTTPPQRKPLTMQERTSIVRANKSFHDKNEIDAYGIIDDVEAAHGIKE